MPINVSDMLKKSPHTVAMSSGFFGFFAHCGFVHALIECGVTPKRITGSSAGALIGGLWASGADMNLVAERLCELQRKDFWDPGLGFGLLKGKKFDQLLNEMLGAKQIEETVIPVALSTWNPLSRKTEVQSKGNLAKAIRASCAVPFMFQPVWIARQPLLDGGISDRPGTASCTDSEHVLYHHLLPRSFWRRQTTGAYMPTHMSVKTIATPNLPKLGPFRMKKAREAMELAKNHTLSVLSNPQSHSA